MTFLVFSVLPAPDSPVQRIDWSSRSAKRINKKKKYPCQTPRASNEQLKITRHTRRLKNSNHGTRASRSATWKVVSCLEFLGFFFVSIFSRSFQLACAGLDQQYTQKLPREHQVFGGQSQTQ
jgi:hypothetical protein